MQCKAQPVYPPLELEPCGLCLNYIGAYAAELQPKNAIGIFTAFTLTFQPLKCSGVTERPARNILVST